jgi:cysteine desulfurase
MSTALEIALADRDEEAARQTSLRDRLISGLVDVGGIQLNGHSDKRLPNNVNVSVDYVEGESMMLNLDLDGICISTGSACSSVSAEPSHVLTALNIPPEKAHCSLRLTLGKWTTEEDVERVLEIFPSMVKRLRAMSPLGHGR